MACVNEGSQFYLPPTLLFTTGMSHTYLVSIGPVRILVIVLVCRQWCWCNCGG